MGNGKFNTFSGGDFKRFTPRYSHTFQVVFSTTKRVFSRIFCFYLQDSRLIMDFTYQNKKQLSSISTGITCTNKNKISKVRTKRERKVPAERRSPHSHTHRSTRTDVDKEFQNKRLTTKQIAKRGGEEEAHQQPHKKERKKRHLKKLTA